MTDEKEPLTLESIGADRIVIGPTGPFELSELNRLLNHLYPRRMWVGTREYQPSFQAPDRFFYNSNHNRACYNYYTDFHRCVRAKGEDFEGCDFFKKRVKVTCPGFWVEMFDEWLEKGLFIEDFDLGEGRKLNRPLYNVFNK
ncbi:cytochrome c oxidase subunit H [Rozella allomycis CSF55]|uniref:Cytochrome c oxidase subunit H n=1 Tax=Rozella allomycis (strain CSF55) TaxID=988480 RepID=A0A075AS94_ROZAC|nr:hypothetical protein O9G_002856 [Rozella allomycis CSF55]RKP16448.1 cytochrome c oxidase subunit H [Rozella allomycis CSF55]|eukprot:EPZ33055.1 hypothetical protein O9G_002856 [Rozella allomycis CSF55]